MTELHQVIELGSTTEGCKGRQTTACCAALKLISGFGSIMIGKKEQTELECNYSRWVPQQTVDNMYHKTSSFSFDHRLCTGRHGSSQSLGLIRKQYSLVITKISGCVVSVRANPKEFTGKEITLLHDVHEYI